MGGFFVCLFVFCSIIHEWQMSARDACNKRQYILKNFFQSDDNWPWSMSLSLM